ncbi:MAG TPA: transposase [bacterium]|nr:transposase [bacterium]
MTTIRKGYRFRLRPTRVQRLGLVRMAGARRWVWNWALARRIDHYREYGAMLTRGALCRELTILKRQPTTLWLQKIDAQALQASVRDVDQAFQNFFARRARFPRFKSKKWDRPTFRIPQRVKIANGRVFIPKIGWVRLRQSRPIDGRITSTTFTEDKLGHWGVSFGTAIEMPDPPSRPLDPERVVGIDQGLANFVVLSNGMRIAAPRYFRKSERSLCRAQRRLSRRRPGSRRRHRARLRIAALYRRVSNRRLDFTHKVTTQLVRTYDALCLQDLAVTGLARTKLAKSVQDAALGQLLLQLRYKTKWNHRQLALVDRWFPSSQLCSQCGTRNNRLSLNDGIWRCACGALHDRDINAAINIRTQGLRLLGVAAGHAETKNARRETVRLSTRAGLDETRISGLIRRECQG